MQKIGGAASEKRGSKKNVQRQAFINVKCAGAYFALP